MRYIDLFSGMGGMRVAIENIAKKEGFHVECVGSYEIKKSAIKQINYLFPNSFIDNVLNYDFSQRKRIDLLLAGFPCQPFSKAGMGKGFNDERGNFIFNIFEILKYEKPRFFILENVDNIMTHDSGKTFDLIINELKKIGYNIDYRILNTKDFNIPQNRKRLFIVGDYLKEIKIGENKSQTKNFIEIMEKNVDTSYYDKDFTKIIISKYQNIEYLSGKYLTDKRGGKKNIHSWDLNLFGKVMDEEKIVLNHILYERRKKEYSNELNIEWRDGMPMTVEQINKKLNLNNINYLISKLEEKKYLKKKLIKDNIYGYSIISGRLGFPFSCFINPNSVSNTLTAMETNKFGVIDSQNNVIRRITKREGLRLFGYPESYTFSNELTIKDCYDLLGNTLGVPIIEHIFQKIIKNI